MVFIVGLGNPGPEYATTRHNVGWLVLDALAQELGAPAFSLQKKFQSEISKVGQIILVKPQTFMNDSGVAVRAVMSFYDQLPATPEAECPELVVFHDDLDLEFGSYKLQFGKGPKIHNGLLSIYDHLHSHQFWHGRVGVDDRAGDRSMPGRAYVLQSFNQAQRETLATVSQNLIKDMQQKSVLTP